jgi:hypothetical protein
MSRRLFLKRVTRAGFVVCLGPLASSCGTLLHPERVGQPAMGRIDPAVAILDGLGLLLFVVPGIVAFIVDFATGAIYLPPQYVGDTKSKPEGNGLVKRTLDRNRMSRRSIEETVTAACGKTVRLVPGTYQAERLETLSDHNPAIERLTAANMRARVEVIFRCQSPYPSQT